MAELPVLSAHLQSRGERWDHVTVRELRGREAISQLFSFEVDVACDPEHTLPEDAQPGQEVSLVLSLDGAEVRAVHGMIGRLHARLDGDVESRVYHLTIVPRATRLALFETQEVFLDQALPAIVESKLAAQGLNAGEGFELRLREGYPAREFVAQYKESDLAFLSRLTEHWGVSFFFDHGGESDKVVFTDQTNGFPALEGAEEITFRPKGEASAVFALGVVGDLAPTNYIVQDYNYRTPQVDVASYFSLESGSGGGVIEYGSHVKTPEEAQRIAKIRAEERLSSQKVYEGRSGVPALSAGHRTTLAHHPQLEGALPLLLTEVTHEAVFAVFSEGESVKKPYYHNTFKAVPAEVPYRPPRRTPRPVLAGVMTGIIQPGADGETGGVANLDAEGRYIVQIHFDTAQRGEQKASHRMRLAQPFAGADYGMHMPLRRGTEVLLAFTNGDPDRPVIVGALYNATSPSPVVAQNANKHQIKTSSGALLEFVSKT